MTPHPNGWSCPHHPWIWAGIHQSFSQPDSADRTLWCPNLTSTLVDLMRPSDIFSIKIGWLPKSLHYRNELRNRWWDWTRSTHSSVITDNWESNRKMRERRNVIVSLRIYTVVIKNAFYFHKTVISCGGNLTTCSVSHTS